MHLAQYNVGRNVFVLMALNIRLLLPHCWLANTTRVVELLKRIIHLRLRQIHQNERKTW